MIERMAELYGKTIGEIFRLWITGDSAKSYVLKRITEKLAPSDRASAFEDLIKECLMEAHDKIQQREFHQPKDWHFSVSSLLNASRIGRTFSP